VFDAADWQFRCGPSRMIDENHSCLNASGHALASLYICGKE
jgi:hypothetical protein